jgi:plasmid stabilization system protein ParE
MTQVKLSQQARAEIIAAKAWYERQAPGLGLEFARVVDAAVTGIARSPLQFQRLEDDYRRIVLRRFPYMLIYVVEANEVVILSCFHQRREPQRWQTS